MNDASRRFDVAATASVAAVVVGASAGALEALTALFGDLPGDFPAPIFVVVHLPPDKKSAMAECLQSKSSLQIKEAEDKEPIQMGTVYFAPPDYHLLVEHDQRLSLSSEEAVRFSRPSIDVLFESAADVYGASLVGVILSGANNDGTHGLQAVIDAGGVGLVQRPDLAHARAMPQAALEGCPTAKAMSVPEIAISLQKGVCPR